MKKSVTALGKVLKESSANGFQPDLYADAVSRAWNIAIDPSVSAEGLIELCLKYCGKNQDRVIAEVFFHAFEKRFWDTWGREKAHVRFLLDAAGECKNKEKLFVSLGLLERYLPEAVETLSLEDMLDLSAHPAALSAPWGTASQAPFYKGINTLNEAILHKIKDIDFAKLPLDAAWTLYSRQRWPSVEAVGKADPAEMKPGKWRVQDRLPEWYTKSQSIASSLASLFWGLESQLRKRVRESVIAGDQASISGLLNLPEGKSYKGKWSSLIDESFFDEESFGAMHRHVLDADFRFESLGWILSIVLVQPKDRHGDDKNLPAGADENRMLFIERFLSRFQNEDHEAGTAASLLGKIISLFGNWARSGEAYGKHDLAYLKILTVLRCDVILDPATPAESVGEIVKSDPSSDLLRKAFAARTLKQLPATQSLNLGVRNPLKQLGN